MYTPLDEVELHLNLLIKFNSELIRFKSYKEITEILNDKFELNAKEEDVFLLYEPSIEELEDDLRIHFEAIGLYY